MFLASFFCCVHGARILPSSRVPKLPSDWVFSPMREKEIEREEHSGMDCSEYGFMDREKDSPDLPPVARGSEVVLSHKPGRELTKRY